VAKIPALAFALLLTSAPARAEIIDRILAVVNGQIITLSDAQAALRFGLVPADVGDDPVGAALQRLIDRRLMLAEVDRYAPPEPAPAAIDAVVAKLRANFKDALDFETVLTRHGLLPEELRRFVRDTLRLEAYLEQRYASMPQASAEERDTFLRDWLAGLRRRASIVTLQLPTR
jgi:hypothetical protein